ncbi:MAG: hypothetical protein M3512_06515 [Bacteroidota bacterium]|nr:hypothetical protein [Bacteroidota bacterium]
MQNEIFFVFFYLYLLPIISHSQNGNFSFGARSAALGNASVTIHDAFAMFNNISGIAKIESLTTALAFENRYGVSSFNIISAGVILPKKWGKTTLNIYKFGDEYYNEHKIGLGYANNLGMVSLGGQINYIQYFIEGFGTKGAIVVEFGGIAEIIPELVFGAHIFNISQAKLQDPGQEYIATIIKAGLSYRPISKLMINLEAEKDVFYKARYKTGAEYEIVPKFFLRSGFTLRDKQGFHGIGFWPGRFQIDYTLSNNFQLGFSHQASLTYKFLAKKNDAGPH